MHLFISAGEPSGDLHGANLIRTLRELRPDAVCVGFGGDKMEAAGARLLYPLCRLAVMWFLRVVLNAALFVRLLVRADRYFRDHRPDAVILIDYPGFHWWVARRAHARGIPVFYFVPPQLWGWAGWRVKKMRRWVDHVLCCLPFEEAWYHDRDVRAEYVGHPYFDELPRQRLDAGFLREERARPGPVIALLPGSRRQEVTRNFPVLLQSAERLHAACPSARFLVACFNQEQERLVRELLAGASAPVEIHVGRTAEILELAHSCIAVSGSISLEMLFRGKPAVIVYRISRFDLRLARLFMTSRFICLVNLLAGRELYPEFLTVGDDSEAIAAHVRRWVEDPTAYEDARRQLAELRGRVAVPGACDRAARFVLGHLPGPADHGRRQVA
jgi:lipid-A-disaccharide synthase